MIGENTYYSPEKAPIQSMMTLERWMSPEEMAWSWTLIPMRFRWALSDQDCYCYCHLCIHKSKRARLLWTRKSKCCGGARRAWWKWHQVLALSIDISTSRIRSCLSLSLLHQLRWIKSVEQTLLKKFLNSGVKKLFSSAFDSTYSAMEETSSRKVAPPPRGGGSGGEGGGPSFHLLVSWSWAMEMER